MRDTLYTHTQHTHSHTHTHTRSWDDDLTDVPLTYEYKMKKDGTGRAPGLEFAENPDILATVSRMTQGRPGLVVGFAAETDDVIAYATAKRIRKGCDWIVANDVSPATGIMGGSENAVTIISDAGAESWPRMGKDAVARQLALRIAAHLGGLA